MSDVVDYKIARIFQVIEILKMNPNKISAYEFPRFQHLRVHIIYLNKLRFGFAVSFFFPNITIKADIYLL